MSERGCLFTVVGFFYCNAAGLAGISCYTVRKAVVQTAFKTLRIMREVMTTELTLRPFLWRAETLFPHREIVSRTRDGRFRYTYAEYAARVARLAHGLETLGVGPGDRVGTLCYNTYRHLEAYFAVPDVGATLHTLNINLPADHLAHLIEDAQDSVLLVAPGLLNQVEALDEDVLASVETVVVTGTSIPETGLETVEVRDYESLIAGLPTEYTGPPLDEEQPAVMCYTSGTTGLPKGVEYSHKTLWTQAMAAISPAGYGFDGGDTILQSVPMFHINGWLWPYQAAAFGARLVLPGPDFDPEILCRLIGTEDVTFTGMVPTVWLGIIDHVEATDTNISSLQKAFSGGSAPPDRLIEWCEQHGVDLVTGSGMTEVAALGTTTRTDPFDFDPETEREKRGKAGHVLPGMRFRAVDEASEEIPWDGESVGELQYKGPWVTNEYYNRPEATGEGFEDGWFKTGDIVTVDSDGFIDIVDREDHLIKSGGEWISSADVENTLVDHSAVSAAAVIARDDERWGERPVAYIELAAGATLNDRLRETLRESVQADHPDWWAPDEVTAVEELPRTATGKLDKTALAEWSTEDD
jgi:fatty-acyl-CoA synthase